MTVETASYISQLDPTYPAAGDPKSEGDNHLRLLKTVLKNAVLELGANAISANAAEVNYLVGVTSAVQTQLNTLDTGKASKSGAAYTGTHDFTAAALTVPTQTTGDATTKAASTAFVSATAFNAALPGRRGMAASSSRPMGRTRAGRTSTARRQSSAPTPTPSMAASMCSRQA